MRPNSRTVPTPPFSPITYSCEKFVLSNSEIPQQPQNPATISKMSVPIRYTFRQETQNRYAVTVPTSTNNWAQFVNLVADDATLNRGNIMKMFRQGQVDGDRVWFTIRDTTADLSKEEVSLFHSGKLVLYLQLTAEEKARRVSVSGDVLQIPWPWFQTVFSHGI